MSTLLTLPTELLIQIFSSVSSSSDLYHLLQTSKHLRSVVKPKLYHQIIIADRVTRQLLKNVNSEDAKRVRKLVIRGHDNLDPYTIGKDDEGYSAPYDQDKLGQGCFRELFEGILLDLSSIETLHISNLREELEWIDQPRPLVVKIASNLVELSVTSHTGTHQLWDCFLRPEFLPKLRRIGFRYVTQFLPIHPLDRPSFGEDRGAQFYPETRTVNLPSSFPFDQLDVLALYDSPNLEFPLSKTLLLVGPDNIDGLETLLKTYPNVRFPDWYEHPLNLEEFRTSSTGTLEFLSLPSLHGKTLSEEGRRWIEKYERGGGQVRWDRDRDWMASSCIPKHFVEYLEGIKRLSGADRK